jgi:hypothetical protein
MIYDSDHKNDRLDARMLARLGRVDVSLLAPIRHRRAETQADLTVVRSREALVATRVKLVNVVRGMVKSQGKLDHAVSCTATSLSTRPQSGPLKSFASSCRSINRISMLSMTAMLSSLPA